MGQKVAVIYSVMEEYQKQLVTLLSHELFNIPSNVDLTDEIIIEARQQTVSLLISEKEYKILAKNIRVNLAHASLTDLLSDIPFVTIKGYASAHNYPHPEKRTMGDVDLLVSSDNYQKASEALIRAGFNHIDIEHERHEVFCKDDIVFELHSEIKGIPNGRDGIKTTTITAEEKVRYYISDIFDTAESVQTPYGIIVIPSAFHHGLIMLLHIAGHMINDGGVGLRHLCDWAVYAEKNDISLYKSQLKDMGLWVFACQLTAVCEKYLGLKKMEWTGIWPVEFIDSLFEDIISSGNFGKKGKYRGIMNRVSIETNKFYSIAHITQTRFPITKKHPIMLPGAIVYWGLCYIGNCIIGKRKMIKNQDLKDSKKRIELYKRFKLFECEENK